MKACSPLMTCHFNGKNDGVVIASFDDVGHTVVPVAEIATAGK